MVYNVYNEIKHVLDKFDFCGEYVSVEEIGAGNVNSTYKLIYSDGEREHWYILQRINKVAFRNPNGLMENVGRVIEHISAKLDPADPDYERRLLRFIKSNNGTYLYPDKNEYYWRAYIFVAGATAHNYISDPKLFYEAGKGFGEFQKNLADFPAEILHETIPNFHNTKRRFFDFVAAVAEDRSGRAHEAEKEIDFIFDHRKMMNAIVDKLESGELPVRVTHNDTKLNNVLIDDVTGKAICVIDLDTVMPGSSLYDYGDAIRYGASTAAEDERDLSKVSIDMELFKLFTKGFIEETGAVLDKNEIHYLPLGIKVLTCELAMRFLTDFINGDEYFKVDSPHHNLRRARAQMKLLTEIEARFDEMTEYVDSLIAE
ncbi:MAG: aminoglycoside phosphotransferase family protein [Clostridia bacterium]|nr:aminoglycoside phosphotransferase family protein [Clostridia bacterium]